MIGNAIRELFASFRAGKARTLMSITTVSIVILIFGGFLLLSHNLNLGFERFRSKSKIEALLKEGASGIAAAAEIQNIPGVVTSRLYTKEEALHHFLERQGEELTHGIVEALGFNPFPAFLEVTLSEKILDPAPAAEAMRAIEGIDDVLYGRETSERLARIAETVDILTWGIGGIISFCLLLIVINSIRSSVHARREEIFILKLIGASHAWVRAPFLLEGALVGFLGAAIGLGVLYFGFYFIKESIPYFQFRFVPCEMLIGVTVYAIALGMLGSVIAAQESRATRDNW